MGIEIWGLKAGKIKHGKCRCYSERVIWASLISINGACVRKKNY
jgi:hypothetical protein